MSQDFTESDTMTFCETLWENWVVEGGAGPCAGCPAHWSIRTDFPGDPDTRTSSYGHRPFYGDGSLTDVDVVIYGHEPGKASIPDNTDPDDDRTTESFADVRNSDVTTVPDRAGTIELAEPLFEILDEHFGVYWSQMKKCNEYHYEAAGIEPDGRNRDAERQCVGLDGHTGYLEQELKAVDPRYVITLGKRPHQLFTSVFEVEDPDASFSQGVALGDHPSGLRTLSVTGERYTYVPTGHPSRGVHHQTTDQLDIELGVDSTKTRGYYEQFARDLVEYDR